MKKSIKEKLLVSLIYALFMTAFNVIKVKMNTDFIEIIGDYIVYFIAFLIAQYLTEILFDVIKKK